MHKIAVLFVGICMLCFSMTGMAASFTTVPWAPKENIDSGSFVLEAIEENNVENVDEIINRLLQLDENDFNPPMETEQYYSPQPLLGEGEVFGLWIHIIYKDRYGNLIYDGIESVDDIDPTMIKGKLSDPLYRTPIKFDVDDDSEYDIETGFGFFRYGIGEIKEDGSTENHAGWATAFDFMQINNMLDDQLGELEVWQEFHVNLELITKSSGSFSSSSSSSSSYSSSSSSSSSSSTSGTYQSGLLGGQLLGNRLLGQSILGGTGFAPLQIPESGASMDLQGESVASEPMNNAEPLAANEDYFVTRVGYRSPANQKIPIRFEKKFVVAKDNIFRPFIFQKEMDPNDIIGTASNDVMFSFQSYQAGHSNPSYDVEFTVNFDPAVYTVTQFIPREGKIVYYYHDCGVGDPLDITFSSNVLKGGTNNEEDEGTLSLTLTLDTPNVVAGTGKWMLFDATLLGDWEPLGGELVYAASHKFNVGVTVTSPRFEQKIEIKDIPKHVSLSWDADLHISNGDMFKLDVGGFVDLSMSSQIDKVIVYYPKTDPEDPELTFIEVKGIPSGRMGADATLYVDPDDFSNPANYIYARGYRTANADLQYLKVFLPDPEIEIPVIKITDLPANVNAEGKLLWNKLQGHAYASRSQAGAQDPIYLNIDFGQFNINNVLRIRDGNIRTDFHIAEDGYFGFDCTEKMFANTLNVTDLESDSKLTLIVNEVSADNLWADWDIDTSGGQIQIEELALSGFIDTLKGFHISLTLESKNLEFDADWVMGESGSLEFDFTQEDNIYMDFDLSQGDFVFYGDIELYNDLHWDISWKWEQGDYTDPAYFKINENSNDPNIKELNLFFTYQDTWGADITLTNGGIYVCLEWYWHNGWLYTWPVIDILGTLDFWVILDWLTNYEWREIV